MSQLGLSHLFMMAAMFGVMMGVVQILPGIIQTLLTRYRPEKSRTSRRMDRLFFHLNLRYVLAGFTAAGLVVGIVSGSWILGLAIALFGTAVPRLALLLWKELRSAQFETQLLDGLILMNNALKSGLDIATGIELIANSTKPPISEEFGLTLNAYRLGAPLEEALLGMTERIKSRSLETAVGAIVIQRETGGNLVKTFDQLIATIREEAKLQKKIKALSAQGRTQIAFLTVFPWGMGALMYGITPETFGPALASTTGQLVLVGLIVWEAIGILVTKRIVTVDV